MENGQQNFGDLTPEQRLAVISRAPGAIFVTGEESLRLRSLNAAAGVTLTCSGRFWRLDGSIEPLSFRHVPNTDRTLATTLHKLGVGWLTDLRVVPTAGTPLYGQCWALVELVRGFTGGVTDLSSLVGGCVTANQPIMWPGTRSRGTLDGPGVIRSITGTNPAAGAEISETVPTGARWRLLAILATLTADANVANRVASIFIDDGTNVLIRQSAQSTQGASESRVYSWFPGSQRLALVGGDMTWAGSNRLILLAGSRIRTSTALLQAGDDWSAPQLLVEEWIEGA